MTCHERCPHLHRDHIVVAMTLWADVGSFCLTDGSDVSGWLAMISARAPALPLIALL